MLNCIFVVSVVLEEEDAGSWVNVVGFHEAFDHGDEVFTEIDKKLPHIVWEHGSGRRTEKSDRTSFASSEELLSGHTESLSGGGDCRLDVTFSADGEVSTKSLGTFIVGTQIRSWSGEHLETSSYDSVSGIGLLCARRIL